MTGVDEKNSEKKKESKYPDVFSRKGTQYSVWYPSTWQGKPRKSPVNNIFIALHLTNTI